MTDIEMSQRITFAALTASKRSIISGHISIPPQSHLIGQILPDINYNILNNLNTSVRKFRCDFYSLL